jgi:hypothetical protein
MDHWCQEHALTPIPALARISRDRVVAQQERGHDGATTNDEKEKRSIAGLQEYVQGSKESPLPAGFKALRWSFDERMVDASLEFCSTVRFLLDGVPHHVTGAWQSGKRHAKRDTAERAYQLYASCWGALALPESEGGLALLDFKSKHQHKSGHECQTEADQVAAEVYEAQELARLCSGRFSWSHKHEGQHYVASVEVLLLGVPHTFAGCTCNSLAAACRNTACRVLWYLQCPGHENSFEADTRNAKEIPEAPVDWVTKNSPENEEKEAAKQKTLLMRLQNRLQQAYSKRLVVGAPALVWEFTRNTTDRSSWTQHVRATAFIPAIDRRFPSEWKKTQREAQLDACKKVSKFLDDEGLEEQTHGGCIGNGSGKSP